jgi:hypothetical protein
MSSDQLPEWERVLSAAARLQKIIPEAVLVGGTASAVHAGHRFSQDADHVVRDLRERFDAVLAQLESVAGWTTARVNRPVMILGNLDGIETGIRQLIRSAPLETTEVELAGQKVIIPTEAEVLRIKGWLVLRRNATRDYLDFAALADRLGPSKVAAALREFDSLYPQANGQSALMQLQVQLANPMPYDLDTIELAEYKGLNPRWHDWQAVKSACQQVSTVIFDRVIGQDPEHTSG